MKVSISLCPLSLSTRNRINYSIVPASINRPIMESLIALFEETETFLETFFPIVPRGITCAGPPSSESVLQVLVTECFTTVVGVRMEDSTSRLVKPILGVS